MNQASKRSSTLEDKVVYDWHRVPLGTVVDARRDPKTHATTSLIVNLTPDARHRMGTKSELVTIPASFVCGIRRDAVTLDRSVRELQRPDTLSRLIL